MDAGVSQLAHWPRHLHLAGAVHRTLGPEDVYDEAAKTDGERHDQMTEHLTHRPRPTEASSRELIVIESIEEVSE